MWDWEIITFLRDEIGMTVFSPYSVDLAKSIFRTFACKKTLHTGVRFLMFQDSPGEGMQANIFKRFYWWEKECTRSMEDNFGLRIVYKSYAELCERARSICDTDAKTAAAGWSVPAEGVPEKNYLKAVKIYLAVKETIGEIGSVEGVGANCLNESFNSETTPCLAWNLLYERDGILWACEGDTLTLVSKFIFHYILRKPIMMTNIYPFLVGMAALKHEKIDSFPDIDNSDNHALGVHCGYFGLAPQSFCTSWTLRPKVLEIVNDDALMADCRFAKGDVTLAKLHPDMKKLTLIRCEITDYVQYPGSDCRNGALIHYKNDNGHQIMDALSSHHALIIQGDHIPALTQAAKIFGFTVIAL
jgi:L-fucose isomerase-like protein